MKKARINNIELQYEVTGSGDALLLISTGPIADSFFPFLTEKALADRYRLIRYRQQRIGNNKTPVSFAEHADDAAALLDHLGIRSAHVAGHSTGAAIALQLAVDHPELVQTLVLLEPPLMSVPGAAAFFENVGPALEAYASGDPEQAIGRFMSVVCSLDWETCRTQLEKLVPGSVAVLMSDADNFFASYLPALNGWQFGSKEAAAIYQPVLSVVGSETDRLFVESHDLLHTWFPQLDTCTIDGVAHLLHLQRPEPVARGIADFCAGYPMINRSAARNTAAEFQL